MTAQKGSALLLKVGDGGSPTETFATLGGLQVTRLAVNQRAVDATARDSGAWRALLASAGIRSVSISASGMFTDAASEETLRGYAFAGSVNHYQLSFGNGDLLQGSFLVTAYDRAGNHDAEERYSLTLESSGTVTFTPA